MITDRYLYDYDEAGNKISIDKTRTDLDDDALAGEEREIKYYEYNKGNRLVSTYEDYIFTGSSEDYEAYVIQNAETLSEDNFKSYKYDNRGNLIEVASGDEIFSKYDFDARN